MRGTGRDIVSILYKEKKVKLKRRCVFCDFARPSLTRGNEVWDDLGFDPTEAERRQGQSSRKYISFFKYYTFMIQLALLQRLREVSDQILDILQPHTDADQFSGNAGLF